MNQNKLDTIKHFIRFCKEELNIQSLPAIKLISDRSFVEQFRSYGEYSVHQNQIKLFYPGRNLADICRSLAHELVHHRQKELNMIGANSGETGSEIENEANALAGILMRDYGKLNLSVYDLDSPMGQLSEAKIKPENEIFSAYNGRYLFDVTKAYQMIESGKVKSSIKPFKPYMMKQLSHPEFSVAEPGKVAAMKLDYSKPLGIVVKFEDPETNKSEWILIDGNHRTRKASESDQDGLFYVITDPKDVNKFMKVDTTKAHQLFPDDDE